MVILSKNDVKRGLSIPDITEDLAYFCGVVAGDGHLHFSINDSVYLLKIVGNKDKEKDFYDSTIKNLFRDLFSIDIKPRLWNSGTTYGIQICSKGIVGFLSSACGIPIGKKSDKIIIPKVFSCDNLKKAFICGLADTDFCLTLKRRYRNEQYYPAITGTSKSRKIIEDIAAYLRSLRSKVCVGFDSKVFDKRTMNYTTINKLYLYGHEQLVLWMKHIGFRNPKHLRKYAEWKRIAKKHNWPSIRNVVEGL